MRDLGNREDPLVRGVEDDPEGNYSVEDCHVKYASVCGQPEPILKIVLVIRD
ncbi:MAG: hypothetical protein ACNA7X_02815 [Dehalococcoidia bacterium]